MVVAAGKRQETEATTGLAHLTEHAMYTGTETTGPGEHERRIEELSGKSNAFTREDFTLFYDHEVPIDTLDEVLAMEADRLRNLSFDKRAVHEERERLRKEEAATWQPSEVLTEKLEAAVFLRHPYRVGLMDERGHTLAPSLELSQIREFYDRNYQPGSVALVVAGAIEPTRALDAIEQAFASLPPGAPRELPPEEPDFTGPRSLSLPSRLTRDRVEWVWLVPAMGHPDRPALELLARLAARQSVPSGAPVFASMGERVDKDLFRLAVTGPNAAQDLDVLLRELLAGHFEPDEVDVLERLQANTLDRQPLRARPYFSLAGTFGVYEVLGHADVLANYKVAVSMLTLDELVRVARSYLDPAHRASVHFAGTGDELEPLPEDPGALLRAAVAATQAGDLDRAVDAYTAFLAHRPNKMNQVIALASRGQVRIQQRDYGAAILDFEQALEVIDYPDVHNLLDEARALEAGVSREDFHEASKAE